MNCIESLVKTNLKVNMYQNLTKRCTKLFIKVATSEKHEIFNGNSKVQKNIEGCISNLKDHNCQPRLLYLAKIFVII